MGVCVKEEWLRWREAARAPEEGDPASRRRQHAVGGEAPKRPAGSRPPRSQADTAMTGVDARTRIAPLRINNGE
jgi:hypothetical protein